MSFLDGSTPLGVFVAGAVFAALAGGWHCAAMCGGLAALARHPREKFWAQMGRLSTYVLLGLVAATLGSQITRAIPAEGRWLAIVIMGLLSIWILFSTWSLSLPRAVQRGLWNARSWGPPWFGYLLLGVLNGLLPCHWLYGFLLVAATLGDPLRGGLLMGALWLGSLPWLMGTARLVLGLQSRHPRSPWIARGLAATVVVTLSLHAFMAQDPGHSEATHGNNALICGRDPAVSSSEKTKSPTTAEAPAQTREH